MPSLTLPRRQAGGLQLTVPDRKPLVVSRKLFVIYRQFIHKIANKICVKYNTYILIEIDNLREKLKNLLNKKRFEHCLSVETTAIKLAKAHNTDPNKAAIAGLLHDCARWMDEKNLLNTANKFKINIDAFIKTHPKLLHSIVSSYFAKEYFGIKDKEILLAIKSHTIGAPKMTKLEKLIYVADHIEPRRGHKHLAKIRKIANKDLDYAIVKISSGMIQYLLDHELPIYLPTIITRNYYLDGIK